MLLYKVAVAFGIANPCVIIEIKRFSFQCRKTKTKVFTLTCNHNSRKQSNEPIRARSKYMSPVPSAGKRVRVNHD